MSDFPQSGGGGGSKIRLPSLLTQEDGAEEVSSFVQPLLRTKERSSALSICESRARRRLLLNFFSTLLSSLEKRAEKTGQTGEEKSAS